MLSTSSFPAEESHHSIVSIWFIWFSMLYTFSTFLGHGSLLGSPRRSGIWRHRALRPADSWIHACDSPNNLRWHFPHCLLALQGATESMREAPSQWGDNGNTRLAPQLHRALQEAPERCLSPAELQCEAGAGPMRLLRVEMSIAK